MEIGLRVCVKIGCQDLVLNYDKIGDHVGHEIISFNDFQKRFGRVVSDEYLSYLKDSLLSEINNESDEVRIGEDAVNLVENLKLILSCWQ